MPIGNIYVIAGVAVVGGALFGFDISSVSAQLSENSYKCYFNQGPHGPPYSDTEHCSGPRSLVQGGITASMAAGSWLGALISGPLSDRLGRKWSIMSGCIVWMIGSILSCASQNIGMLIVGRIINGLSVGVESAQVPVYIGELSPPSKRGRFIGLQQFAVTWGILIMQMVPAIFLFFMMMLLPESPRWLARKDRWEEAHEVLALVHGQGDPNHPFVAAELQDIKDMCEFERQHANLTYFDLFKPNMLLRTTTAIFMQIWAQLTGMNVMMYYISYIFSMAGYKGNANLLASSIQYVINVIMTIPALIWMDKWGRRPTLLIGATLMGTFMFANAGILAVHGTVVPGGVGGVAEASMSVSGAAAKGLIACTYLFVASYAPTWGPVSWTYPPELFPLRLRGKGVALATSANWAFNTALGLFTPVAFVNIRWQVYIIFGVFNAAMFIHVFLLFKETAGHSLEAIEGFFEDPNGMRYIGTPAWKTRIATNDAVRFERGDVETKLSEHEHEEKTALPTNGAENNAAAA
ncbi:high affinity glucose transporter [Neonectria magnoliae]|uniref:High affinity glucose transporter n=1 Tax=Neonectria magnoliae TaxID=2732573 RepID=A0ABR1I058_9HYPO